LTSREPGRPITILHLSDLRFGWNHPFGRLAPLPMDDSFESLLAHLLADVGSLHDEDGGALDPDLLLLTGDLTNGARPSELRDVLRFIDGLARGLRLPLDRVVVVPGNHDVSRDACAAYFSSCRAEEIEPRPPFWPKWRFFATFFKDLYRDVATATFTEAQPWTFFEIPDLKVVVAGINSTMAESHRDEDHYGFVGSTQIDWFARELEQVRRNEWLRIAAVHHDLRGEPTRPEERVSDQGPLLQALGERVSFFVHGHTWDGRHELLSGEIPVFAAGSGAPRPERGTDEPTNQYQVLQVRKDRIRRWTRICTPGRSMWRDDPRGNAVVPVQLRQTGATFYEPTEATLLQQKKELAAGLPAAAPGGARSAGGAPASPVAARERGDFLSRVEVVCRLREKPGAEVRRMREGRPPIEYLRVAVQDGGITRVYPVGVVDRMVIWEDLIAFVDRVHARYQESDTGLISRLVYFGGGAGSEPPPEDLAREAASRRVHLLSFRALQDLIDFQPLLARQTRRLETDQVYYPGHYVAQRVRFEDGDPERGADDDALANILSWLEAPEGRFILLLGDSGTGKTFLLRELARRVAAADRLIPILIEMRHLEKSRSLDQLLGQHFAQEGMEDFSPTRFRYMLEQGRIALLFDGFDELVLRVTYDRAADHLDTLLQAAVGAAKVIVTSRKQHFISDRQVKMAMGEQVDQVAGRRIATLLPFDRTQITRFLERFCGDGERAARRFQLLEEVRLLGLAENPRMLSFIADLPEEDLLKARKNEEEISAPKLYEILLKRWLGHEHWRVNQRGSHPALTVEQRWKAVTELALRLWRAIDRKVSLSELTQDVALALEALTERQRDTAAFQIGSGTLLVRDEEGYFSFIHQSVLEWLVARHAAELVKEEQPPEILAVREASDLMLEFFATLAEKERAVRWARLVLSGDAFPGAKQNAMRLLKLLDKELEKQLDLSGRDLRGRDESGQDYSNGNFSGADLSAARLVGTVLTNARLADARLVGADLTRAQLDGADLQRADLTGARLLGASLRGARLDGAVLRRAKLVGAKVERSSFDACDTYGAALAAPSAIQALVAASFPVSGVAWNSTGELVAAAAGNAVQLWDTALGREVRRFLGHTGRVLGVAFGPDGNLLASGAEDGTIRLWDAVTGEEIQCLTGHGGAVWSVAFARDGRLLASASADRTARLWEVGSSLSGTREARRLQGYRGGVRSVAWSPDGAALVTASEDSQVRLWKVADGSETLCIGKHGGPVLAVDFRLDGRYLASASEDRTARVWDLEGRELCRFAGHEGAVQGIAFSPDGRAVATAGEDRTVRLWDLTTKREARCLQGHEGPVHAVAFSSDGRRIASASADRSVRLWDRASGQEGRRLAGWRGGVWNVSFNQDGRGLVSLADDRSIRYWDVGSGQTVQRLKGHPSWERNAAFSPDGARLAGVAGGDTVRLWNLQTGQELQRFVGHEGNVLAVAFSPDGRILASASVDKTLRLWDVDSGRERRRCLGHQSNIWSVVFSPDGGRLASASEDRTVRLWDTAAGREIRRFVGHQSPVGSVAFSPDGRTLASASTDRTVRLWEAASGLEMQVLAGHQAGVLAVAFHPDGKLLASASMDGSVRLWTAGTPRETYRLTGHAGPVWSVAFSPDGRLLASGAEDNTVRLWDPRNGACVAVFALLPEGWAAYTPNGRYKLGGTPAGGFWHVIGLCRFEPGELDPHVPGLRLRPAAPLLDATFVPA
jgi:WD40 repeat protein